MGLLSGASGCPHNSAHKAGVPHNGKGCPRLPVVQEADRAEKAYYQSLTGEERLRILWKLNRRWAESHGLDLDDDSREFIELLNSNKINYMIARGHAVAFHGSPRMTGDIDIFVEISEENANGIVRVLGEFGFGQPRPERPRTSSATRSSIISSAIPRIGSTSTSLSGVTFEQCSRQHLRLPLRPPRAAHRVATLREPNDLVESCGGGHQFRRLSRSRRRHGIRETPPYKSVLFRLFAFYANNGARCAWVARTDAGLRHLLRRRLGRCREVPTRPWSTPRGACRALARGR